MRTLHKCFQELYKDALAEVRERLEKEALSHREISDILQRRIDKFEAEYTREGIDPFSDEMAIKIETDFLNLIQRELKTTPKIATIKSPIAEGLPETEEDITFYAHSDGQIKEKIEAIKKSGRVARYF
jgi:hypothetical protein